MLGHAGVNFMENIYTMIRDRKESFGQDKGAGLVTVFAFCLAAAMIMLSITSLAAFSASANSTKLSTQQADDAAESGASEAVYRYMQGDCANSVNTQNSADNNKYIYNIYRNSSPHYNPRASNDTLMYGCPTKNDRWMIVDVTGFGKNNNATVHKKIYYNIQSSENVNFPQAVKATTVGLDASTVANAPGTQINNPLITADGGYISCRATSFVNANIRQSGTTFPSNILCGVNGDVSSEGVVNASTDTSKSIAGDSCSKKALTSTLKGRTLGKVSEYNASCNVSSMIYGYVPATETENPYRRTLTPEQCDTWDHFQKTIEGINNPTVEITIDTTNCNNLQGTLSSPSVEQKKLIVKANLTFIMPEGITMSNIDIVANPAATSILNSYNVNFVMPSTTSGDNTFTCPSERNSVVTNLNYTSKTGGMLYTPCSLRLVNSSITGQVYGGDLVQMMSSTVLFRPIGLPNPDKTSTSLVRSAVRVTQDS